MQPSNPVLSLTIDLLANQAFSHLPDDKISELHHLILRLQEPLTHTQQILLLSSWNYASTSNLPAALLHRCNTVLLNLGRRPLEEISYDVEYAD